MKSKVYFNSQKRRPVMRFSAAQKKMAKEHGTPAEFAISCYESVPSDISMWEAAAAIKKYNKEWDEAQ